MDILEIPLIVLSAHQLELLLQEGHSEKINEWPDIRYIRLPLTREREVFFYLFDDPVKTSDFSAYNLIVPRAPFSLILFERENVELEAALNQYESRFSTPCFLLTAKLVDDTLDDAFLARTERRDRLILFDSQRDFGLKEALLKAIKLSSPASEKK